MEREANLHPLGRFLMRVHLCQLLETRLRLAQTWSALAEAMEASPIERPIFITGFPRSGSTFLHELLSETPKAEPASLGGDGTGCFDSSRGAH
jgi:Sulfotransferase family